MINDVQKVVQVKTRITDMPRRGYTAGRKNFQAKGEERDQKHRQQIVRDRRKHQKSGDERSRSGRRRLPDQQRPGQYAYYKREDRRDRQQTQLIGQGGGENVCYRGSEMGHGTVEAERSQRQV